MFDAAHGSVEWTSFNFTITALVKSFDIERITPYHQRFKLLYNSKGLGIVAALRCFADTGNPFVRIQMYKEPISPLGDINDKSFH